MSDLIKKARRLGEPEDYFHGLDWRDELLPSEIVSFCRVAQNHRTNGWEGISAKAGRYDQHSRYVLLIALEGNGCMGIEAELRDVREGEAHFLRPHQLHYYVDLPEKFTWLYLTFDLPWGNLQWREGGRRMGKKAQTLLEEFLPKYEKGQGLATSMLLGQLIQELEKSKPLVGRSSEEGDLMARVKSHIMSNLEGNLALPAIAKAMDLSESHLRSLFREHTGVSLGNFVRSARLVRATHLLSEGKPDLKEIAERTGFTSLTALTRAFRRVYEITPSQYRRRSMVEL